MRQPGALVRLQRLLARLGDVAGARQTVARDGERIAQRSLCLCVSSYFSFYQCNVHTQIRLRRPD